MLFSREQPTGDADLTRQALSAYYAADEREVTAFCKETGVDTLVVDLRAYSSETVNGGQVFWEPYNRELLTRIAGRTDFALARLPDELKSFRSGSFYVVPCSSLAGFDPGQ